MRVGEEPYAHILPTVPIAPRAGDTQTRNGRAKISTESLFGAVRVRLVIAPRLPSFPEGVDADLLVAPDDAPVSKEGRDRRREIL
jgi:hypothetical protein